MASSECTALAALATSLNLPLAARNDAPTASCCQWKGLDCTTSGQVRGMSRVAKLELVGIAARSASSTAPASTFWTRDMIIIVASCSVAAVAIVSMFVTLFCWERNKRKAAKEQAILERQLYEQFDAGVAASHAQANRIAPPNSAPNSQLGVSPHMTPMSMATTPVQEPRYSVVIDPYAKFYNNGVAVNGSADGSHRTSSYSNVVATGTGTPPPTPDRWEWHRTSYLPPAVSHAVDPATAEAEHVAPLPPGWDVERARNAPPRAPSYAVS
ncbi:hypothetical protein AMAG_19297 [Allomyces macrogynus ATCC 38327]|uniref:Uncharacterized protein n=1 Tax=Allomyces macrogynus (strain ATCC 38327) TaxID=578462 RepID=A0A0L0STT0_ALLM3|nr:hypothetical protein AMAG_19297 [Allomyces macrogynus ATCC 38327]|eukprot:KNE65937.1 hypothetical protein AMAG_19297 [Allomyces macrogynus ATCC 38327]